ncbi:MAG: DUF6067 family protein [Mediterranea sp.]|jgi:hypothetical protein|nr:DUF6067 family protein [Mediterranea sp.]
MQAQITIIVWVLFCLPLAGMAQKANYQLRWGSVTVRYPQEQAPSVFRNSAFHTPAWRGERVNAQALIWSDDDLEDVTVTVSRLTSGQSVIPQDAVSARFVGYVMTDGLTPGKDSQCGYRLNKAEWDSSMVADRLELTKQVRIKAGTTRPVWIQVWVPVDAKAGTYTGKLTVSGSNCPAKTLPISMKVTNRTLPAPQEWAFHLDLWQNPYAVARYDSVELWSQAHFDAMRPVMKILADAGQKVITATLMDRPWNGQTEDPFHSMIGKTKRLDGTWEYDYMVFDRWVEFMYSVGIDRQINCYSLIPWALSFDYYDQAAHLIKYVNAAPGSDAYNEYWGSFIKDFARHLRAKGWFDKTTIAMDERPLAQMKAAVQLIRRVEPEFKIALAGNYHTELESELYDYCIAFGHEFPADVKARRLREGKVSTVYTCCTEAHPNTFTFSDPAEAAWIGWHVMAKEYDGYLRWSYNSWTADPLTDSRFRTWPAGDCYIVYPRGESSIRMEMLIEGIQDFEKCRILRDEYRRKGDTARLKRLQQMVDDFTIEHLMKRGAATMVEQARKAWF